MITILMVCIFQNVHAKVNSVNLAIIFNFDFVILPCNIFEHCKTICNAFG